MADPDHPATIIVAQAGALLGISRRTAYRAAATGHIPTIRVGRRILVPTALIHRMLGITDDPDDATGDGAAQQPEPDRPRDPASGAVRPPGSRTEAGHSLHGPGRNGRSDGFRHV